MSHSNSILKALLDHHGKFVSGENLSKKLGVSRTSVWKSVRSLRREGYEIDSVKGRGYRLRKLTHLPVERELTRGLKTENFGRRVHYFNRIDSTNRVSRELARKGEPEGTLIVGGEQSSGKGRLGRAWESPLGGIYMSLILRPNFPVSSVTKLTLLLGLAVVKAIKNQCELDVKLKWPNDIMVDDMKLGGILCEVEGELDSISFVIAGIGINTNSDVNVEIPTTYLKKEMGLEVDNKDIIRKVLLQAEELYFDLKKGKDDFINEYNDFSNTIGNQVKILIPGRELLGKAVDVDKDGALILRLDEGSYERVLGGDCFLLR